VGKDEVVRGFVIGTWITLHPEFVPEVSRWNLIKLVWDLFI
jgi:hypothetical protein